MGRIHLILFCLLLFSSLSTAISHQPPSTTVFPTYAGGGLKVAQAGTGQFVSTWNTTVISNGSSGINQLKLPLIPSGSYNFTIFWGDATVETITNNTAIHTYSKPGQYSIIIAGTIVGWMFNNIGDRLKLREISQWGSLNLGDTGSYFYGASNMVLTTSDLLNLTGTTSLHNAFRNCNSIGSDAYIDGWNVSQVVDMSNTFYNATSLDGRFADWIVSNAKNMTGMFHLDRISPLNYDDLLQNWIKHPLQRDIVFDAGLSRF